jgi:hypothetical protein
MKKLIIFFTFLILILSGCSFGSNRNESNEHYRTGTQGLTFNFLPNMPPTKLYDDEPFAAIIEVNNRGATDIISGGNSRLYISGYDPNILIGITNAGVDLEDIDGKSMYDTQGGYNTYDFEGTFIDLSTRKIDEYDFNLLATLCYDYQTISETTVCLDPDPNSRATINKACNGHQNPSTGSQGAPVQVTSIEVEPLKGRTKFKIHVANVGGGTVFLDGFANLDRCSPYDSTGITYDIVDYVTVTEVRVANVDILDTCKPIKENELKLINGQSYFVCEMKSLTGPAYTTTMSIVIDYGYRQTMSQNIKVIATSED